MQDHLEDTLTVDQIVEVMAVSPERLERSFGEKIQQSPLQVYRSLRLEQAKKLLIQTELPISEISVACGFSKWNRVDKVVPSKIWCSTVISAVKGTYRKARR